MLCAKARTPAVIAETAQRDDARRYRQAPARDAVADRGSRLLPSPRRRLCDTRPGARRRWTQALVKRLYFDGGFKPGFAKIEQSLIARFVLDPAVSKRDQLEMFLNRASFGSIQRRPITGFANAARTFYGRPIGALDDRQYLGLVAMLMAPNALDPVRHPGENAQRVDRIVALLAGRCRPRDLRDVRYPDCAPVSS